MADIWSVVDTKTGKIEKSGFDKKQDAKALRNELNKPVNEKKKAEIDLENAETVPPSSSAKADQADHLVSTVVADDRQGGLQRGEYEETDGEVKSMIAIQQMLNKMMDGIKGRIDVAEKEFETSENTFPMLDLDGDGELSKEEIQEAMHSLFKRKLTDAES